MASEANDKSSPNIVLIMCDDLGYGDLACFNADSPIRTPHLDAMAAAGVRLTRFYAAAPVCSPTRASCLTGRHPSRMKIAHANVGHLPPAEVTLPELLQDAGYRTGFFGKWHLGTLTTEVRDSNRGGPRGAAHFQPPPAHGFDVSFATEAKVPTYDPMWKPQGASRIGWDALPDLDEAITYGTRYWQTDGTAVIDNLRGDDSRVIADRAVAFIEESVKAEQPFCAVIWFHAPHLPVVAGPQHVAAYAEHDLYRRNYYGCVSAMDEQVGRLRACLKELGVRQRTVVCFTSDNGPEGKAGQAPGLTGGLRGRKRSLSEGGIRVPAFIEWPGKLPAGEVSDFPMVTSDYLPTIADWAQVSRPLPAHLDGISLASLWEASSGRAGEAAEREQPIGFHFQQQAAWVTQRYKIYRASPGERWQLYDLQNDAAEQNDLAEAQPQRVAKLVAAFEAWRESCLQDAERLAD